jgi:hypothetical protein
MANASLSPKREAERVRKHHAAVFTLALQRAKAAIKRQIQARGHKRRPFVGCTRHRAGALRRFQDKRIQHS